MLLLVHQISKLSSKLRESIYHYITRHKPDVTVAAKIEVTKRQNVRSTWISKTIGLVGRTSTSLLGMWSSLTFQKRLPSATPESNHQDPAKPSTIQFYGIKPPSVWPNPLTSKIPITWLKNVNSSIVVCRIVCNKVYQIIIITEDLRGGYQSWRKLRMSFIHLHIPENSAL